MAEVTEVVSPPKVVVSFKSKVDQPRDKQYENSEAMLSMECQFDTPNPSAAEVQTAITEAYNTVKANVFDVLGIEHTKNELGIVTEVLRKELGAAVVSQTPAGDPKEAVWLRLEQELRDNQLPNLEDGGLNLPSFWDRRPGRTNPKAPSFVTKKGVKGIPAEFAVWENSVPDWFDQDLLKEVF